MSRYADPFPSTRERVEHEPALRRERRGAPVDVLDRPDTARASVSVEDYLHPPQPRYGAPARRPDSDYDDAHLISSSDSIIPYVERREISPNPEPRSRPRQPSAHPRPQLLRRQSSLDTFDRAATRRAHDYRRYDRDEYGPPVTPVSVPQRRSPGPPSEPGFDDIRVAEPDFYGDEEFRNMRDRERSETPRGRRYPSLREEVIRERVQRPVPKRGKTRIPKRLVNIQAVMKLNYPYEDEGDSILILKALAKENIDELVDLSTQLKKRSDRAVSRERVIIGAKGDKIALERTRSQSTRRPSIVRRREASEVRPPRRFSPPPMAPQPQVQPQLQPPRTRQRRRSSPIRPNEFRDTWYEDVIQPRLDQALVVPARPRRTDSDIVAEIKALEEERQLLRPDRSPARLPAPRTPEAVVVKKDYKGPSPRLLRAMMASLT